MRLLRLVVVASLFMLVLRLRGWPAHKVQGTGQQVATVQVSPIGTCCQLVNSIFSVNVLLILPVGQQSNGFDVRINYTKASTSSNPRVPRAVSISYSNNVFSSSGS